MTRDDALLWVHETVGDELEGDAPLDVCIDWIRENGTPIQIHELNFHVLPILEEEVEEEVA